MKAMRTGMIWRITLFMGATYALAVSAGEILTDETGERFHSHAVSAQTRANAPAVADEAALTGARPCDRIAHIDQRSHAEYVPGVYVAGKPVVPADAYCRMSRSSGPGAPSAFR